VLFSNDFEDLLLKSYRPTNYKLKEREKEKEIILIFSHGILVVQPQPQLGEGVLL